MPQRTFVTGFLLFGGFEVNPSALLAESCGRRFELLEVSFSAVDDFLARFNTAGADFDRLLMLGLRGDGTTLNPERFARNYVGAAPDVRGIVRGPGPIEPGGVGILRGTLFDEIPETSASFSDDAGCYLCNYIYYRALRRFPGKRVGFAHVPPTDRLPLAAQRSQLARILDVIEDRYAGGDAVAPA